MRNKRQGFSIILVLIAITLVSSAVIYMASATANSASNTNKQYVDAVKRNIKHSMQNWYDTKGQTLSPNEQADFKFDSPGFCNATGSIEKSNNQTSMKLSFQKHGWTINHSWKYKP